MTEPAAGASLTLLGGATFPTTQGRQRSQPPPGDFPPPADVGAEPEWPPFRIRRVASGVRIRLGVYSGITLFGESENQKAQPSFPPPKKKHLSLL